MDWLLIISFLAPVVVGLWGLIWFKNWMHRKSQQLDAAARSKR